MRTAQREKIYGYAFKAVLSLILLFCLYNVACILFLSPYKGRRLQSRVSNAVSTVESIVKHAGPKKAENIIYKSNLVNKTGDSSRANQITRETIFSGPKKKIRAVNVKEELVQYEETVVEVEDAADNTEIIFKGVAGDVAYINVKKEIDGEWCEHGFPTRVGEKIGNKKIVGGKMLDFTTNYVLQDIVYDAQRPVTLNKRIVNLNEAGGFIGTSIVSGETYMKSTSKIRYRDEDGNINGLWLKE